MKLLAALLALFLLAGCANTAEPIPETTQPPEQTLHVPGHTLEQQTSGIIEVFPTEDWSSCQLYAWGANLLASNGETHCLYTGKSLRLSGSIDGGIPVHSDGDSLWLYDSATRKIRVLGETLEEAGAFCLPADTLGVPGVSGNTNCIYFLKADGLYVWDRPSDTIRVLRDNMAVALGSVWCLENGSQILVRLTDPNGEANTLLLSAADGSALYEALSPADAAGYSGGTMVLSRENGFQKILCFPVSGTPQELLVGAEEQFVCFLPKIGAVITLVPTEDFGITANLYSLFTGQKQSTVTLPGITQLLSGCVTEDGLLYLPAYSQEDRQWYILRWNYSAFPPESDQTYLVAYTGASAPDPSQAALCREKADALSSRFGIRVAVLEDAAATQPWDYALRAAARTDETLWALETVETLLSCFPDGFLAQLQQNLTGLSLCLVDSIQGTSSYGSLEKAQGLQFEADKTGYIALALSPPEELRYTLVHELSHLIDAQVILHSSVYDNWNDLNPQEFSYSLDVNADMSRYAGFLTGTNRCFVDAYAMSYPTEDRARILEYAANPGNEALFVPPVMQQKLRRICQGIREAFSLTDDPDTFLWEQYLLQYGDSQ